MRRILFIFHLFIFLIVISLVASVVFQFKSIPGPPYGGDLYFHNGIAEAIFYGTPPIKDPTNVDSYAFYPWLYHIIVATLAHVFGSVIFVTIYVMPLLIVSLASAIGYLLGQEFLGEKLAWIGIVLPLVLRFPDAHPRTLLIMVWIPLFYLAFLRYLKNETTINALFVAFSWGLAGLTHVLGTFGIGSILTTYLFLKFWDKRDLRSFKNDVLIFAVAIVLLMSYWGPLLFVYHAHTPNPYQKFVMNYYSILDFTKSIVTFLVPKSIHILLTPIAIVGIYAGLKTPHFRNILISSFLGLYLVGICFILLNYPLITYKIHTYYFALTLILILLGFRGIQRLSINPKIICGTTLILLIGLASITVEDYATSKWVMVGYNEFMFPELQEWILSNTKPSDVFLSSYESSFMLFSISGRKIVLFRRTHASPFVDYDKRSADIIIALVGENITRSLNVLRKYNVKYVYLDNITKNDPLWVPIEYKSYLEDNGVSCNVKYIRYDPADEYSIKIKACVVPFRVNSLLERYLTPAFKNKDQIILAVSD